jgi:hypothetical protein
MFFQQVVIHSATSEVVIDARVGLSSGHIGTASVGSRVQSAAILVHLHRTAALDDPFHADRKQLPMGALSTDQLALVIATEIQQNLIEKSQAGLRCSECHHNTEIAQNYIEGREGIFYSHWKRSM